MKALNVILIALFTIAILVSCGHARKVPLVLPDRLAATDTSEADPQWLIDALTELDALQRPADANPSLYAGLKADLTRLLHEKVSGKLVSSISEDYTVVADLRFKQDSLEADVYLEWSYVNRGDYDQSGTVAIADLTPIAQQYKKRWFGDPEEEENPWLPEYAYTYEYRTPIVSVVDGNLDGWVYSSPGSTDGDLLPLAQNFGNTVANYTIYGSDDPEDEEPEEIETIAFAAYQNEAPAGAPPKRLFYRFNLTEQELEDPYAYYWVRPDDGETPLYGAYSDSYWEGDNDSTPNPADLRPVIGAVKPANHIYGQRGTDVTFSYNLSADGTTPTDAQEWDFGGASSGSQSSTAASPTITLTNTIGDYYGTVTAENDYGISEEYEFVITVTTDQSLPVVADVTQEGFTPNGTATFTCNLSTGPGESFVWLFAGKASPNSITTTASSVTVTLNNEEGMFNGAWVRVTNEAGTAMPFFFPVRIGFPPINLSVSVPEVLVKSEIGSFSASFDGSTSPPTTYTWNFGDAGGGEEVDYVSYLPNYAVLMQDGDWQHGTLTVNNTIGEATVGFDFYVHWNELRMRLSPYTDFLPGSDNFVTVIVEGYDIGHPLAQLPKVYLEYNKSELAPPGYAELSAMGERGIFLYPDEWNAGAVGNAPLANDGWWLDYGTLLPFPRAWFFYIPLLNTPHPSVFGSRSATHYAIMTNISAIGDYSSEVGDGGIFFNFRMYLPEGIGSGDFPYSAELKNYRYDESSPPNLITYYLDDNDVSHAFSNEPSIWIDVHDSE